MVPVPPQPLVRVRVRVRANEDGAAFVPLPRARPARHGTTEAREGSCLFMENAPGGGLVADVLVEEDETTLGRLDEAKLRAKYRGHPKWDRAGVLDGVEVR